MKPEATITEVDGVIQIQGYAYTFEDEEIQGGPANGGWIERIDRDALKLPRKTRLLYDFEPTRLLASATWGKLNLTLDDIGLKVLATPDDDTWAKSWCRTMIGAPIAIVVAFKVRNQQWSAAPGFGVATYRLITKLELLDLSVVPRKVVPHEVTVQNEEATTTTTAGRHEGP